MAKRKHRKKVMSFDHSEELYGVAFILIAILGIGKYGPVGRALASFALFLVGSLYIIFLGVLFILGMYLLIKREWPNFFKSRLIGIYFITIGLLIMMHREFVLENEHNVVAIFKETINELVASFNSIMNTGGVENLFDVGGGLVGGCFAILFDKLFSYNGMQIVSWSLIGLGLALFTGFSIVDMVKESYADFKERKTEKHNKRVERKEKSKVKISAGEEIDDKPTIITSIDDLKKTPVEEEKKEEIPTAVENDNYQLPSLDLLDKPKNTKNEANEAAIEKNIDTLEKVLRDFKITGKVVEVHVGPSVVQYELDIASGTRVNKILAINREISLALAKKDVRIEAPIPGKNTVGIEFANDKPVPVSFYEIISSKKMQSAFDKKLMVPLGKSIMGEIGVCEINKMPHLLIAGTTGSGKSVCVNGIICSILMRAKPDEVKLVMVDPKVVELSVYNGIPHLMCPVVTDPKKASIALAKMVAEMERRYEEFSETKTKNIEGYNAIISKWNSKHPDEPKKKMPYVVVIIDELADLMVVAAKEVEDSILRITQKARAAGIHLIVATQRPSTDVITGLIKANIPSRISFSVGSGVDSRTILDQVGAEKLLGKGDMLYLPIGMNTPTRIQGSFITDDEIKRIIDHTIEQQKASYDESLLNLDNTDKSASQKEDMRQTEEYDDPLYNEIVEFVIENGKASASLLQRKFKLGYNRAARIIDLLEERGIVGPQNGSKPRQVLIKLEEQENDE